MRKWSGELTREIKKKKEKERRRKKKEKERRRRKKKKEENRNKETHTTSHTFNKISSTFKRTGNNNVDSLTELHNTEKKSEKL